MEPVWGLSIKGISAAIPVGEKKLFVADTTTGKPVHFLWTFDLDHLYQATRMGKEVRSPRRSLKRSSRCWNLTSLWIHVTQHKELTDYSL